MADEKEIKLQDLIKRAELEYRTQRVRKQIELRLSIAFWVGLLALSFFVDTIRIVNPGTLTAFKILILFIAPAIGFTYWRVEKWVSAKNAKNIDNWLHYQDQVENETLNKQKMMELDSDMRQREQAKSLSAFPAAVNPVNASSLIGKYGIHLLYILITIILLLVLVFFTLAKNPG